MKKTYTIDLDDPMGALSEIADFLSDLPEDLHAILEWDGWRKEFPPTNHILMELEYEANDFRSREDELLRTIQELLE